MTKQTDLQHKNGSVGIDLAVTIVIEKRSIKNTVLLLVYIDIESTTGGQVLSYPFRICGM